MSLFKRRRFPVEIILLCVRWYCKYGISYRDLAEMMSERGVAVDPATIFDGSRGMHRSLRNGFADTGDIGPDLGASMRPMCGSAGNGSICFVRSTSMGS